MTGTCQCGCGRKTSIATHTKTSTGRVKGKPCLYLPGHGGRKAVRWREENRGFETPCWIWQLSITPTGYGIDRRQSAHRAAWEAAHGPIPEDRVIHHRCRERACVNPDHLELSTPTENARQRRSSKLTLKQAKEIRSLCAEGWRNVDIAQAYAVHQVTVSDIRHERTWQEVAA